MGEKTEKKKSAEESEGERGMAGEEGIDAHVC